MSSSDAVWSAPGSLFADRVPKLWALWAAARPSQLALIVLVYGLGVGMATTGWPLTAAGSTVASADASSAGFFEPVALGVLALVPVSVTIHYANEYADVETDALTDRTPFSGGSGALDRTGLPRSVLRSGTIASFVIAAFVLAGAAGLGLPIDALAFLVAILVLGLAYSLPPIAFVRRGVGEVVNAALGGVLLPLYGVATVASARPAAALAVVPFALLVGCTLLATHWPDRAADETVGKRTLAVRWSPPRLRRTYTVLAVAAGSSIVLLWTTGVFPTAVFVAHALAFPALAWGGIVLTRQRSPFPAVLAMVVTAAASTVAWWQVGIVA